MEVATLPLPVNTIMFASNRCAREPTHNGSNSLILYCSRPPILNLHSTAELSPNGTLTSELSRRCLDHIVKCRDWSRLKDTTSCRIWQKFNTLLNLQVRVFQFHSQLDQSCLLCPMSDFSWSWNRHCSLWAPPLTRSCVRVVIPSQGNKLKM